MGDHSGQACFDNQLEKSTVLKVKEDCIIAGIDLAEKIFQRFDDFIKLTRNFEDGESLTKGTVAYTVKGPAKSLLSSERLVLKLYAKNEWNCNFYPPIKSENKTYKL